MFDWAKLRSTKGAAKLHLLLDHDGCLPCYARICYRCLCVVPTLLACPQYRCLLRHFGMRFMGLLLLFCLPLVASAATRVWTNNAGQEIEAEFLSIGESTVKIKLISTGKIYDYPIANLSEADKEFIEEQRSVLAEEAKHAAEESARLAREAKLNKRKAEWFDDYDDALAEAKDLNIPVLLLFTGSDWCGYCIEMEEKVFSQRDWQTFANKNLVLMKIDFPSKEKLKRSVAEQNDALKEDYGITGYPTLVLIDPKEKRLGSPAREYEKASNFI